MHPVQVILRALLISLLLLLQHGALLHGLSHVTNSAIESGEDESPALHYQTCALCAAYAHAGHGPLSSAFVVAPDTHPVFEAFSAAPRLLSTTTSSYLTRAPPYAV